MTRRDSLEKAGPETQIGSSTSDPQKLLTYGLKKKKEKAVGDANSRRGGSDKPNKAQDRVP